MSMYVRVKRHLVTYFIHCEPSETTLELKLKVEARSEQPADKMKLILLSTDATLDDSRTLAEQKVENDCVLGLVYQLESGGWEAVKIDTPTEICTADMESA